MWTVSYPLRWKCMRWISWIQVNILVSLSDWLYFLSGTVVKVQDKLRHPNCFVCTECEENLKQKGYYFIDDELYCETHAHARAKPPESPDLWPSHSSDYTRALTSSQLLGAWPSCFNHRHNKFATNHNGHRFTDSALSCRVLRCSILHLLCRNMCVAWSLWIKHFVFWESLFSYLCSSRTWESFPDTWNIMTIKTHNKWFCVFTICLQVT